MRRLPPNKIEQNLSGLLNLLPEDTDELLQRVDQPLEEATCKDTVMETQRGIILSILNNCVRTAIAKGRKFLLCDYNRDGDSYRSPWSNKYNPPLDDGFTPPDSLRTMEVDANEMFDAYRELYFEGGTSSVYLWDLESGFAGCFLIKKAVSGNKFVKQGEWDSIHVVEVRNEGTAKAHYKLTTTVMLNMGVDNTQVGETNMCGSLTRQVY